MSGHCPECNTEVGEGTIHDAYQHAVSCFHLPVNTAAYLKDWLKNHPNREYARRATACLEIS